MHLDPLKGLLAVTGGDHLIPLQLQIARHEPQQLGIVVGNQDRRLLHRHGQFSSPAARSTLGSSVGSNT